MGCGNSRPVAEPSVRPYTNDKPKSNATVKELARSGVQRESSDSLKSFSDSALNVKLSSDKNLVLVWDGETPSKNAYYEQAVMVLKVKGIEFVEEVVTASSPPAWFSVRGPFNRSPQCAAPKRAPRPRPFPAGNLGRIAAIFDLA